MKTLLLGIGAIVVIGLGGFFYRNVMEREPTPNPVACTMDVKTCPDGSFVGRTGPRCEFTPCPFPSVEVSALSFVLPEGYEANREALGNDATLLAAYEKDAFGGGPPHAIVIRSFPIPAGKTGEDVIVGETIFETSDMGAESIDQFEKKIIGGREFYRITVERFEAQIHSLYYLLMGSTVYRFEVLERDVAAWMEPSLVVEELPEHAALLGMLQTLRVTEE